MSALTKKSPIVEVFTASTFGKQTELQKADYADAMALVKELASNPNPNNRYELSQIVSYVLDNIFAIKMNYLPMIAEVKNTAFDERPNFKIRTEKVTAFWQAIGSSTQKSKIGYKYSGLTIDQLSARPVVEWVDIATGRMDFNELIRDVMNEFEMKVAQKVQSTLYATFSGLSSPNYGSGSGVVATTFDPLLAAMQRIGRCAIIGDYEALQKLPALTAIASRTSDTIIDEVNRSGIIGTYKGAPVVVLDNPYTGLTGFNTVLDKGYIYIVPAMADVDKTLKIQFAGTVQPLESTNIEDSSYEMRFDKHMGAGVLAARHPLAVYEDTSL